MRFGIRSRSDSANTQPPTLFICLNSPFNNRFLNRLFGRNMNKKQSFFTERTIFLNELLKNFRFFTKPIILLKNDFTL